MSWYMVRRAEMKLVVWGTGEQHEPQLFNLTADPGEWNNLARGVGVASAVTRRYTHSATHAYSALIDELDTLLRSDIDYPAVTKDVASYNVKMARWWMANEPKWRSVLGGTGNATHAQPPGTHGKNSFALNADWGELWREHPPRYWDAWWRWVNRTGADANPDIPACPASVEYGWTDF